MTICLTALACFVTSAPESGFTSYYAPDIMKHTIEARLGWGHLPDDLSRYDVFAAVADCGRIGDEFLINYTGEWERGIVTDCAGNDGTPQWMEENNILTEVDYQTAARWGIYGRGAGPVTMAYIHCRVIPGLAAV